MHQLRHNGLKVGRERGGGRVHLLDVGQHALVLREVHERPAAVCHDARLVLQAAEQRLDERPELHLGLHRVGDKLADAAERPCGRVLHRHARVVQRLEHRGQRLRHERLEHLGLGTVHDAAEAHERRLAPAPVGRLDVGLDERHRDAHDRVADHLGKQAEAGARGLGHVPLVLVRVLVLVLEQLHQHRRDLWQRHTRKLVRHTCRLLIELEGLGHLDGQLDLLVADGGPELDRLQRHVRLRVAHAEHREPKERLLHVEAHLVVVQLHDAHQVLERGDLDRGVRRLRRLAHHLHDVVALALALKVAAHKLERVEQRLERGELHLGRRLLLAGALDHRGEDLVGLRREHRGIHHLAGEPDRLERRLP